MNRPACGLSWRRRSGPALEELGLSQRDGAVLVGGADAREKVAAAHPDVSLHVVLDNEHVQAPSGSAHGSPGRRANGSACTSPPTGHSWLNMAEIFFGIIARPTGELTGQAGAREPLIPHVSMSSVSADRRLRDSSLRGRAGRLQRLDLGLAPPPSSSSFVFGS
jgi:hypothetical protein